MTFDLAVGPLLEGVNEEPRVSSQVDKLGLQYKSDNFGAEKSPGGANLSILGDKATSWWVHFSRACKRSPAWHAFHLKLTSWVSSTNLSTFGQKEPEITLQKTES